MIINCYKQYSGDELMFVGIKNLHSRAIVIWETGKIVSIAFSCCNDAVHWISSLISFLNNFASSTFLYMILKSTFPVAAGQTPLVMRKKFF